MGVLSELLDEQEPSEADAPPTTADTVSGPKRDPFDLGYETNRFDTTVEDVDTFLSVAFTLAKLLP